MRRFIYITVLLLYSSFIPADDYGNKFSNVTVEIIPLFSMVSMTKLDNIFTSMGNSFINSNYQLSKQLPSPVISTELAFNLLSFDIPGFALSMKFAYLYIFPAYLHAKRDPLSYDNYSYEWNNDFNFSFIPVFIGITYNHSFPKKPFFVGGSVYIGAAMINSVWKSEFNTDNPAWTHDEISSWNFTNNLSAISFVAETNLGLGIKISKNAAFQLIIGYRFANVDHLSFSYDTSNTFGGNIKTGAIAMGINSGSIALDFSGLIAGAAVTYKF